MHTLLTVVHFLVCVFLITVILLQAGKGADIGATFGAGGSQTMFGPRGAATLLSKLTAGAAVVFLCTSLWLAQMAKPTTSKSVLDKASPPESQATSQPTH
ncbi:MAG: preprotein translocase subunit SecG [Deltaproteobacteria bacterium]|nr:preprotein translocase subunit SecG [Deltaproteobacteria bacterium]